MPKPAPSNRRRAGRSRDADQADRYDLYQQSVQLPDHEVRLFERAYRRCLGGEAVSLREDFCGTFAVSCLWAQSKADRQAVGVDLDEEPVDWGREHNLAKLDDAQRERVAIRIQDVREVSGPKADVLAAQNFSYFTFRTRAELKEYFKAAYRNIKKRGVVVLDIMGGGEVLAEEHTDTRELDGFTYAWEQHRFDPISSHITCFIHFRFDDGSKLERAFRYDWRLWTVPEVRELLVEVGFRDTLVYWEGADRETGEGNGVFSARKSARSDPAWIAYIVGVKEA